MEERETSENSRPEIQNEQQTDNTKRKTRKKTKRILWVAGTIIFIGAASVCLVLAFGFPAPIQARIDILPDRNAMDGTLHSDGDENVNEGEFLVMFNQLPTIKAGSQECNIEYENPAANHYSARINLYKKSTGNRLGGTRRVDPGKYVEYIELSEKLEAGEYPVTARIELFTGSKPSGSMTFDITLRVTE